MSSGSDALVLKGGAVVSIKALNIAWGLEARGAQLTADGDGLLVAPRELLTPEDRANIRAHRDQLLALVRYAEAVQ